MVHIGSDENAIKKIPRAQEIVCPLESGGEKSLEIGARIKNGLDKINGGIGKGA